MANKLLIVQPSYYESRAQRSGWAQDAFDEQILLAWVQPHAQKKSVIPSNPATVFRPRFGK
jgi:hypothetical protein